jgi:lipopolysaccharide/colanic/teichoic acid biosynthesis glycosyltransferase
MLERVRRPANYDAPTVTRLLEPIPLYHDLPAGTRAAKRALDILFSIGALVLYGALLPVLAIAIKVDSPGPVFYSQVRVGINRRQGDRRRTAHSPDIDRRSPGAKNDRRKIVQEGRAFVIYKLRTMYQDSESQGVRWSQKGDSRITRVGRILRKTRLDEFPQFWNVLKGDMSIVGPRPERPPFITLLSDEIPGYLDRLRFKPGITGLAQVENGYDESLESVHRKVALDLEYISSFSIRRDLGILVKSVKVVMTGEGAC